VRSHLCSYHRSVMNTAVVNARYYGTRALLVATPLFLCSLPQPMHALQAAPASQDARRPIVVASKPFGESYILAEMFAQLLETHGIAVTRRAGLGATEIAFAALRTGAIDVYPEYTGTGLIAILQRAPLSDARAAFRIVSQEFTERWGVQWLPPLGFQNTYAIAVTRANAADRGSYTRLCRPG
jgi:glycine betaine/choline ABC-type transport system substrate-binding protein